MGLLLRSRSELLREAARLYVRRHPALGPRRVRARNREAQNESIAAAPARKNYFRPPGTGSRNEPVRL